MAESPCIAENFVFNMDLSIVRLHTAIQGKTASQACIKSKGVEMGKKLKARKKEKRNFLKITITQYNSI